MGDPTAPTRTALEACLGMMNFAQNWDDWMSSLREMVNAAREIDPSDQHVIPVVEDIIDFLSQRVCSGSPEERLIRELWDQAGPDDRAALARIFLRMIEEVPTSSP